MQERLKSIKTRAFQALHANRLLDAKALAMEARDADRRDAEAWTLLAAANAQLGALGDVVECCRMIVSLQPDNVAGHFNLGVAYQGLGKLDKAENSYRRTLQLQPGSTAALINLGVVLLSAQRYPEATAFFDEALRLDPNLSQAHNGYGLVLKAQGRNDEAITRFQTALQLAPESADILYNLGLAFANKGDTKHAAECFDRVISRRPDHADALVELGKIRIAEDNHPEAERVLQRALAFQPHSVAALFHLGYSYYVQERYPQALNAYREVLAQEPGHVAALNNIGRLYERTGVFDEAINHYRLALTHGEDAQIHCNIGRVLTTQSSWSDAADEYRLAIALMPDNAQGHLGLGMVYCETGMDEEAKRCLRRAIELEPALDIAKHLLAALNDQSSSTEATLDYVTDLFDNYAEKFDRHLVTELEYRIPELLNQHIRAARRSEDLLDIMDLGCGTGLCGAILRDIAARLDGIDLSPKMIAKARERDIYDELHVGDITAVLNAVTRQYDLFVATDVFVYIGDLAPVFASCSRGLRPGGLFAFSIELVEGSGYRPRKSGRFAQSTLYIEGLADQFGFELVERKDCRVRLEYRLPIAGMIYVLRRT